MATLRSSIQARNTKAIAERYVLRDRETSESRDDRIIDGLRSGDARAIEAAFFAYYDRLFAHAFRYTRSPEIAEELIQDVFLRIWERRNQLVGSERLQPLLFAAARNASISWLRRQRVEQRLATQVLQQTYEGATASTSMRAAAPAAADAHAIPGMSQFSADVADLVAHSENRDLVRELHEAVRLLPERARLAITLRWQRQLRNTEIAQVMGVSVKAVEFSIARALDHLRRTLDAR